MNIRLPLQISGGQLITEEKMKESINRHIETLLRTAHGTVVCDPEYGFELSALKFENFNETEGTVFTTDRHPSSIYRKKISGSSKNLMTFAAEFNEVLRKYEQRLTDTSVVMSYIREERKIQLIIRGQVKDYEIPYQYKTNIVVWS